jgi:hypothetical protein
MDYEKLTNAEKIELFKIASTQKYRWLQSGDKERFETFEEFARSINEYAKKIAIEIT